MLPGHGHELLILNPADVYFGHFFFFPPDAPVCPDSTSTPKPWVEKNASFYPIEGRVIIIQ
jgi:hypothetical protein